MKRGQAEAREAVTVVIPSHNRLHLLFRTLDSVLRQRGVDVEVVVVDDGSSDGTAEAIEALHAENVRLVRHDQSKGVSAARNAGLELARTPWVAFVDDDDIWAPDKLHSQIRAIAGNSSAAWSSVGAIHLDSDLNVMFYDDRARSGDVSSSLMRGSGVPGGGSGVLASAGLSREVGAFDEEISILADWDFYLRLSLRSPVAAVRRPLVGYYVHLDSMYHNSDGILAEFEYLEHKYSAWPGVRMQIDYPLWYLRLIRMELRKRNIRAAWELLRRACNRSTLGPGPFAWGVTRWLKQKLVDRNKPLSLEYSHEVSEWVPRYRENQDECSRRSGSIRRA